MLQSITIKCTQTRNLRKYARAEARFQGHSDPENGTQHFVPQNASTYRIVDFYLKYTQQKS